MVDICSLLNDSIFSNRTTHEARLRNYRSSKDLRQVSLVGSRSRMIVIRLGNPIQTA